MAGKRNEIERQESIGVFAQLADEILGSGEEAFIASEELLSKIKNIDELSWIGSAKALGTYLGKFDLNSRPNSQGKKRGYSITREWVEEVRNRYLSLYSESEVSDVSESHTGSHFEANL